MRRYQGVTEGGVYHCSWEAVVRFAESMDSWELVK